MRQVGNVLAFYTYRDWLSNHYRVSFTIRDITFNCTEQFLMYTKAMHFGDGETARKILATSDPQEQKMLGRQVTPYNDEEWIEKRLVYYIIGLKAMYRQNPDQLERLLLTNDLILVEASERDRVWGVGLKETDPRIADPRQWRGHNLCGGGHMAVRDFFRQERGL